MKTSDFNEIIEPVKLGQVYSDISSASAPLGNAHGMPEVVIDVSHSSVSGRNSGDALPRSQVCIQMKLENIDISKKKAIVLRIIPLVHRFGGTSTLSEQYLNRVLAIFDLEADVTFIPGRALLTWKTFDEGEESCVELVLAVACRWGFRMGTLNDLDSLIRDMKKGSVSYPTILNQLSDIEKQPPLYSKPTLLLAFALMSAPMAPAFFGGSWFDMMWTFLIGCVAGGFALLSDVSPGFAPFHEAVCSFVCCSIVLTIASLIPNEYISFWPVILSATIWILPGFSMVIGTIDIISGASRITGMTMLFGGVYVAFTMSFFFSVSFWFMSLFFGPFTPEILLTHAALKHPYILDLLLCVPFAFACSLIYHSRFRQIILAAVSTVLCLFLVGIFEVSYGVPDYIVQLVTGFCVGIFIHLVSVLTGIVPESAMYCAILPLVPGSRIVRAIFALMTGIHYLGLSGTPAYASFFPTIFGSVTACLSTAFGVYAAGSVRRVFLT